MIRSLANELKLSDNYCYSSDEAGKFLAWIENGKFDFCHELIAVKNSLIKTILSFHLIWEFQLSF